MAFKVTKILTPNTLEIASRWAWNEYAGNTVKIKGFNISDTQTGAFIINKLSSLLLNKEVELKNPSNPVKNTNNNDEVTVSVYLNGVDISVYFPELKATA